MINQQSDEIDTIAVCVVTNNNFADTKFFFDHLIKNTSGNCKLYIYDYQSTDLQLLEYLETLEKTYNAHLELVSQDTKLAAIYNMAINKAEEKYIALMSIDVTLDHNWISELLYHYKNIANSGCIGIRSQYDDVELSSTLFYTVMKDEDEMRTVWVKKLNVIDTPIFFEKEKIHSVGLINENFENVGYELYEFCFRFKTNGYNNYYVRNTACIRNYVENSFLIPYKSEASKKEFKEIINNLTKTINAI